MKTFGLFMILWLVVMLFTFATFPKLTTEEGIKFILATLLAFIFYKLIKEDENNC